MGFCLIFHIGICFIMKSALDAFQIKLLIYNKLLY